MQHTPLPDKPIVELILHEWDTRRFSCSADALADWLNARWRKSGYELSAETVCEVLRSNGRIAFRGLGMMLRVLSRDRAVLSKGVGKRLRSLGIGFPKLFRCKGWFLRAMNGVW